MKNLILTNDTDFYQTPIIADIETGKRVRFEPLQIAGKGWTVAKVMGSNKSGKTIAIADDFINIDGYTLAQAQVAAENHTRYVRAELGKSFLTDLVIGE